jgi:hypothetical protein
MVLAGLDDHACFLKLNRFTRDRAVCSVAPPPGECEKEQRLGGIPISRSRIESLTIAQTRQLSG